MGIGYFIFDKPAHLQNFQVPTTSIFSCLYLVIYNTFGSTGTCLAGYAVEMPLEFHSRSALQPYSHFSSRQHHQW